MYDTDGQAVTVVKGNYEGLGRAAQALRDALLKPDNSKKAQHFFFANGQQLGSFGQLMDEHGQFKANFDVNFTPVSQAYPSSVPSQVIAQSGDTLRTVAQRVFGDATLWYLIAEENGLSDPDAALTEGTSLRIPNEVVSLSNTASSFKPFDVSDAIGDTTPTQAMPPPPMKKKGCGVIGQIIIVVITVIVAYYTGTYVGGLLEGALGATAAGAVGAVVGAAAGNAAGQLAGMAIGQQQSFSWKSVASAALTSAITGGVGVGDLGVATTFAQGAFNSAVNQGVNIALGLQESFSWKEIAISSASSAAANYVGKKIDPKYGEKGYRPESAAAGFVTNVGTGSTSALVRLALGGKMDANSVLADVFGNAIGNSIVSRTRTGGPTALAKELSEETLMAGADELSEVRVSVQPIPTDENGYRLSNNPLLSESSVALSPDEAASDPEVVVTSRHWVPGEELLFQKLIDGSQPGRSRYDEDQAAEQARQLYKQGVRFGEPLSWMRDFGMTRPYGGGAATMRDNDSGGLGWRDAWFVFGSAVHAIVDPIRDAAAGTARIFTDFDNSIFGRTGLAVSDELTAWNEGGFTATGTYGALRDRYQHYAENPLRLIPMVDQAEMATKLGVAGVNWWRGANTEQRLDVVGQGIGLAATFYTPEAALGVVNLATKGETLIRSLNISRLDDAAGILFSLSNESTRATSRGMGINFFRSSVLRTEMGNSAAGRIVLDALDAGDIDLTFTTLLPEHEGTFGLSKGNSAVVYLRNTQNGMRYDLLDVTASGYEFTAGVGIHEGLHALGIGGSRRAEALVRLAELDNLGVPIDRRAMRQVLTDMGKSYDSLPWRSGRIAPRFPGLEQ